MAAETVASPGHRMASAPLDDVPHRRRGASYPEAGRSDPKHDILLIQDTGATPVSKCPEYGVFYGTMTGGKHSGGCS